MDIFAHGLWTGAAARAVNQSGRLKRKLRVGSAVFWGIFPDLLAFTLPFILFLYAFMIGEPDFHTWPPPHATRPQPNDALHIFGYTRMLYGLSHSAVIFALVFLLVWIMMRRPVWEMLGWLLHILIDIPTHTSVFYPTPFLWPISSFGINGYPWATPWFMVINYTLIGAAYWLLHRARKRRE